MKVKMKTLDVKGITYLEKLRGTEEWYWGTDYIHGDLYEAEELFNAKHKISANRLLFVNYPDGKVIEPIAAHSGQYFGKPAYYDSHIIILLVDFNEQLIKVFRYNPEIMEQEEIVCLPLGEIKNCYNLMLDTASLMLTRQGQDNEFEIIYPVKRRFHIGNSETFCFRKGEQLYFSAWYEDDHYREELIIRDINSGKIIERKNGAVSIMPDGQVWLLT